ncbi:hypothetical protein PanWU01x14_309170, partial [Parasponia andersonii]
MVPILLQIGLDSAEIHWVLHDLVVIMKLHPNHINRSIENPPELVLHQLRQDLVTPFQHTRNQLRINRFQCRPFRFHNRSKRVTPLSPSTRLLRRLHHTHHHI